ncbi:hypothetical protein [Sinomicrobium soli]|uniref:hypothetical protein n=1 Tax=Sinomicrobium sp. N-1-3-6 TaxID=2219864 RepID=UPI000DCE3766|nr:hypothetical protein [Sinomicrobium sp. N-1-3-6]RAV28536.1 hypothetical protein DN748_13040 [Sinomicrobium sp. N-1-3-6]
MSLEKRIVIKEASLANNCPECYTDSGLSLVFYQKHIQTPWYKKTTGEVTSTLQCKKCKSTIYPVKWTEDIERVIDYYTKTVVPKKSRLQLTGRSYYTIAFLLLLIAGLFAAFYYSGHYREVFTTAP